MDRFVIHGGATLAGTVEVSGSKNASLPIMAAALLAPGATTLQQVPDLVDVRQMSDLLRTLGADVNREPDGSLRIDVLNERPSLAEYDLVRRMRASVCVLGPLLARRGTACVSLPGGCQIGHRPIDLHLRGLAALGAEIDVRNGYVRARAGRLRGARIDLAGPRGPTVTGTCNVLAAACLARGTTIIDNAAREPEVSALAACLNSMGGRISGQGTSQLVIEGVEELAPTTFRVIPDRIEAATLLIAAAMTRGQVTVTAARADQLAAVLDLLREMGAAVARRSLAPLESHSTADDEITVTAFGELRPVDVTAEPYPGVPTDVQSQLMALLATLPGASRIRDLVFPDRFLQAAELARMGADIRVDAGTATIRGVRRLTGANVMASDLRASAALVLAGLAAQGETVVHRIYHLDRGYEGLERKLAALGGHVARSGAESAAQRPWEIVLPAPDPAEERRRSA